MKYKVGDRVRIKSIDWYNENKDEYGTILFSTESGDYSFTKEDARFCGRVVTIAYEGNGHYVIVEDDRGYFWIDEMIEGLVEEGTKPKFKVGDKVITDTNMKGKIIEVVEEDWYRVKFEPCNGIPQPNGVVPEESMLLVEEEIKPKFKVGDKDNDFYMNYEESEDYITKRGFDIPWNDCDVFIDEREISRTVGNVLKWADKTMIEKAIQWLFENVYDYLNPEDQERVESFRKAMED